jgi:peptidoglycan/LPS O-acetylase OafA/YrhL
MGSHAGLIGFASGGLVGVTIFFVLSGYLITSLLVAEHGAKGQIDLMRFYVRRAGRLLPALAAVLAVVGVALALTGRLDAALTGVVSSGLYVSNLAVAGGMNLGPLEHTWSLAIEEQFYLVWPVILVVGLRRRRMLMWGLSIAVIVSTLLRIGPPSDIGHTWFVYHHTLTRADALLVGSLLALARFRLSATISLVAGALLLVVTVTPLDPGTLTVVFLFPIAVAAGIVVLRPPAFLSAKPLVAIGKFSYGLYLWHLPIASVLPTWPSIGLTFVVAWVSYTYLESPIRSAISKKWRARREWGLGQAQEAAA